MTLLLQLLWLALPLILSGCVHLLAMRRDWWPALRRAPLDFGATWRGRRLFGANKTWRGACVTILCTSGFSALLGWLNARWLHLPPAVPFAELHPFAWGALLGCGYILGELPNSFLKRQLGIAPGALGSGATGRIFWVVDQLDSLAGMLLCVWPVWQPTLAVIATLVAVMLVAHPIGAWIMVLVGLKSHVG
jgi:CDP-diglyceride synthetase